MIYLSTPQNGVSAGAAALVTLSNFGVNYNLSALMLFFKRSSCNVWSQSNIFRRISTED